MVHNLYNLVSLFWDIIVKYPCRILYADFDTLCGPQKSSNVVKEWKYDIIHFQIRVKFTAPCAEQSIIAGMIITGLMTTQRRIFLDGWRQVRKIELSSTRDETIHLYIRTLSGMFLARRSRNANVNAFYFSTVWECWVFWPWLFWICIFMFSLKLY